MTKPIGKQLVEKILELPNAIVLVSKLNLILEEEKKRRSTFYNDISEFEKAEFINGEIVIHSPVNKAHNDVTTFLYPLLSVYVDKHQLGYIGINKIMIQFTRNDYEPDICFFDKKIAKTFTPTQSLFPPPNLVVEILSKRTARHDRDVKFQDYQAHGVEEYWIIEPIKKIVEQYRLDTKQTYELILKAGTGTITCLPVKGFSIPIEAIFDEAKNLQALQSILAS